MTGLPHKSKGDVAFSFESAKPVTANFLVWARRHRQRQRRQGKLANENACSCLNEAMLSLISAA